RFGPIELEGVEVDGEKAPVEHPAAESRAPASGSLEFGHDPLPDFFVEPGTAKGQNRGERQDRQKRQRDPGDLQAPPCPQRHLLASCRGGSGAKTLARNSMCVWSRASFNHASEALSTRSAINASSICSR